MLPLRIHEQLLDLTAPRRDRSNHAAAAVGHHDDAVRVLQQRRKTRAEDTGLHRLTARGLEDLDVLAVGQTRGANVCLLPFRLLYFKNPS
jgi:hypothetical protein